DKNKVVATLVREIQGGKEAVFPRRLDEPRWSRDGKSILGVDGSSPTTDTFGDIVVCSVETGACTRVATLGNKPMWSADNSRIFFDRWKSRTSRELWSVSSEGKDERLILERRKLDPVLDSYDVSVPGQLVYVQFKPGRQQLWIKDFD